MFILHYTMLLSALSVLVIAQPSSEVPEELMNYPVYYIALHITYTTLCYITLSYDMLCYVTYLELKLCSYVLCPHTLLIITVADTYDI